ncbi:MAG TPA: hypothetical protein VGO67_26025 [Verrucomicrobiae bacterium]|jgi:hypothetical protein
MNEKRIIAFTSLGLLITALLGPFVIAAFGGDNLAGGFALVAGLLALLFGALSWGERIGRIVTVTLLLLAGVGGVSLVVITVISSHLKHAKEARLQAASEHERAEMQAVHTGLESPASEMGDFAADITNGNVRCVLMSVGQTTVFPNKEYANPLRSAWGDKAKGMPCFTITYLVEEFGEAPPRTFSGGNVEVLSGGKPLRVGGGTYQKCFGYEAFQSFLDFGKPAVSDPKRAYIMQAVSFGALPNLQPLTLNIEAGFGKDTEKFQFDSIRLQ